MACKDSLTTYEQLEAKAQIYLKGDLSLLRKAYEFANKKHFGIKRLTGDDYIIHPLNVAGILTDNSADENTLCAALLHDVVEDTDTTLEDLEKEFNKEIAFLVNGVTKINKLSFSTGNNAIIANQRKILVGLCEDVRVIIIKLADRLHNMRTLYIHSEKKQKEKARETLEILTPIAHRLGMNKIKSELEDLSLRYLKPDIYFQIVEQLNETKQQRDRAVKQMQQDVSDLLKSNNIMHEIKGRAKSIYSIYNKLNKGKKFNEIYDLQALRVFVNTEAECYQALGIIHSKYKPIPKRFKDYIAMPKTNMYQSLHTTVFGNKSLFEIQIRTYDMDAIAERGIASHWSYKEGRSLQNAMEQKLQFFRSILELNNEEESDEDFIRSVKEDVLNESVYVFTPKGDVIELPNGSTPIDFAYRVHSEVGDKMIGAVVNNSIVPLDYQLKSNDIIKINTNKNAFGPSREWLNIAHTTQAKNKIKAFYNRIDKEDYIKKGEELIQKELRKRKIGINSFFTSSNVSKILNELKYRNLEELYINIGSLKLPVASVLNIIYNTNLKKEEMILNKVQNKSIQAPVLKNDIFVKGAGDIKVNIASCCKPIPGDRIVGYITKGYGISVHRMVCPNVSETEERIISVSWNKETIKKYPTSIRVSSIEDKNILLDIISKTSNTTITVESVNKVKAKNEYIYDITIHVSDKETLISFIGDIEAIPSIKKVERLII